LPRNCWALQNERVSRSAAATDANAHEPPSSKHVARPAGGWKAPVAMVLVQLFQTGLVLLSKVVIGHGMFVFALVTYRSAFGAAFLFPFALICERCSVLLLPFTYCSVHLLIMIHSLGYLVPRALVSV